MSNGRHSYVAFFPSDWEAGTARLPRLHKSAYHDICCYIWDRAEPVPEREVKLMLCDIKNWEAILDDLIAVGKLKRNIDGSITNDRAMAEAAHSMALWKAKSDGGKKGGKRSAASRSGSRSASKTARRSASNSPSTSASTEPEPDITPKSPTRSASADAPPLDRSAGASASAEAKQIGDVLSGIKGKLK